MSKYSVLTTNIIIWAALSCAVSIWGGHVAILSTLGPSLVGVVILIIGGFYSGKMWARGERGTRGITIREDLLAIAAATFVFAVPALFFYLKETIGKNSLEQGFAFLFTMPLVVLSLVGGVGYGVSYICSRRLGFSGVRDQPLVAIVPLLILSASILQRKSDYDFQVAHKEPYIFSSAIDQVGRLVLTGSFTEYKGFPCAGFVRVRADGSIDKDFQPAIEPTFTSFANIWFPSDQTLFVGNPLSADNPTHSDALFLADDGTLIGRFTLIKPKDLANALPNGFLIADSVSGRGHTLGPVSIQPNLEYLTCYNPELYMSDSRLPELLRANPNSPVCVAQEQAQQMQDGSTLIKAAQKDNQYIRQIGILKVSGEFSGMLGLALHVNVGAFRRDEMGRIVVAGDVVSDKEPKSIVARFLSDGQIDPQFTPQETINYVRGMKIQPDGKILIYGQMGDSNASPFSGFPGLMRLTANGEVDTAFRENIGDGFRQAVVDVNICDNGDIIVTGHFTRFKGKNGGAANGLAYLNSDGSFKSGL